MLDKNKDAALKTAMSQLEKRFGVGTLMRLGDKPIQAVEVIPTGAFNLDIALGIGGIPKGRIIEIYGAEASGKTTLSLHIAAECQKQGGIVAFIDAEHALDVAYAKRLGVQTDNMLLSQPDGGEQALEVTETLVRSSAVDLIIVDSTDPFGPGEGLFTKEFYGNCFKALKEDGIMVNQHESPFYEEDAAAMKRAHKRIFDSFPLSKVYQAFIPTYPSGHWLFGFASKKLHPVHDMNPQKWEALGIKTRYYNTNLHKGSFYLPNYVEEMLENVE